MEMYYYMLFVHRVRLSFTLLNCEPYQKNALLDFFFFGRSRRPPSSRPPRRSAAGRSAKVLVAAALRASCESLRLVGVESREEIEMVPLGG